MIPIEGSITFFYNLPKSVVLSKANSDDILLKRICSYGFFGGSDISLKGRVVSFEAERIAEGKRFLSIKTKILNDSCIYTFSELKGKSTPNSKPYLFKFK